MKNTLVLIIGFGFAAGLWSCREVGPIINLGNTVKALQDTTFLEPTPRTPQPKVVVMEEFTGVRCINCPQGHATIANLQNLYGDRFISIGYHSNFLAEPYPFGNQDLRTEAAQQIQDFLVFIGFKPAASIDRVSFNSNQSSLLYGRNTWNSYVQERLNSGTPVNVGVTPAYNPANRQLTIAVELAYTENADYPQNLSVLLTESDIVEPQLNQGNVVDTFYNHKEVFRKFVTNMLGDPIQTTTEPGRVVRRIYSLILDDAWKPENLHIVAFVHRTDSKVILTGREVDIK